MPTYEYECRSCGHQIEIFQKISENPKKKCPECGRDTLQRLLSASGFVLKGQGWYVTDFRDKAKKVATNAETGAETAENTKADKKPDASPNTGTADTKATCSKETTRSKEKDKTSYSADSSADRAA